MDIKDFIIIDEFSDYMIDRSGNIISNKRGIHLMNLRKDKDGYLEIGLRKNGKRYFRRVHRLVAQTFILNKANKPQVNHINGIKDDNRVENLEWCTCKENVRHSYDTLKRIGKSGTSKRCKLYSDGILVNIFENVKEASKYAEENFNVSSSSLTKYYKSGKCQIKCND